MKKDKDAYGHLMWDYFNGKNAVEIIERDDGFIDTSSGAKTYFSTYNEWPAYMKQSIKYAKGRVLDVGCGAGRFLLYLQGKGLDAAGIDNSSLALKVCRLRGVKKVKNTSVYDLKFKPNSFDTIIMMGNNFGLFRDFNTAKNLLRKFHNITSESALIIAESKDPYKTDNIAHLEYQKLNRKHRRMPGQVRIRVRYAAHIGNWFDYLLVSQKEMGEILRGTGWKVKKFINDRGSPAYAAIIEKTKKKQ